MNNSKTFHRGSVLTAFCLAVLFALQAVCALLPACIVRAASSDSVEIWDEDKKVDYGYRFSMKFQPGVSTYESFGCDNLDREAFSDNGKSDRDTECVRVTSDYKPGSAGMRYNNVGKDANGNIVDVRMTLLGVENAEPRYDMRTPESIVQNQGGLTFAWKDNEAYPIVGFSKNSIGVFIYSVGYAKVNFQFLKHGTDEPLSISGHGTIRDIDAGQGVRIPSDSGLDNVYLLKDNDFLIVDGNYVVSPVTAIEPDDPRGWLNLFYNTDNFTVEFSHQYRLDKWDQSRQDGIEKAGSQKKWAENMKKKYLDPDGNSYCANFQGQKICKAYAYFDFTSYCFGDVEMKKAPEKRVGEAGCTWDQAEAAGKEQPFTINDCEEFQYMIQAETTPNKLKTFVIRDTLEDCLTIDDASKVSVINDTGLDVTGLFDIAVEGQTITCSAKPESLAQESFTDNQVYTFALRVHRKTESDFNSAEYLQQDGCTLLIPNSASMTYERTNGTGDTMNTDTVWVKGIIQPDLQVEKNVSRYEWMTGDIIDYTVTVTEKKQNVWAADVVLTDEIPAGLQLLEGQYSVQTSPGAASAVLSAADNGWRVECPVLRYNETITVQFRCQALEESNGQELENIATATAGNMIDPETGEQQYRRDMAEVWPNSPQLEINKTADKYEWQQGGEVVYRIVVNNTEAGTIAKDVNITDIGLPEGLVLAGGTDSIEILGVQQQVNYPVPDKKSGQAYEIRPVESHMEADEKGFRFYCSYLPYSQPVTLIFHCTAQETANGHESVNAAGASASNAAEQEDDTEVYVNTGSFSIEKTADHYEWQVGEKVEYTVKVENVNQGTIARNVTVWDTQMPQGLALTSEDSVSVDGIPQSVIQSVAGTEDTPNELNPEYYNETEEKEVSYELLPEDAGWRLNISDLPSGCPVTITFHCTVTEEVNGMESINIANVQAENAPETSDDAEIYVNTAALDIQKSFQNPYLENGDGRAENEFRVGEQIDYLVTVNNLQKGSIARNVVISDSSIPEGLVLSGEEGAVTVEGVPAVIQNPVAGTDDAGNQQDPDNYNETVEKAVECQVTRQENGWIVTISDLPYQTPVTVKFRCTASDSINGMEVVNTAQAYADNAQVVKASAKIWVNSPVIHVEKTADQEICKYGDIITYRVKMTQEQKGCVAREVTLEDTMDSKGVSLLPDSIVLLDENGEQINGAAENGEHGFLLRTGLNLIKDEVYSICDNDRGGILEQVMPNPLNCTEQKSMTVQYQVKVTEEGQEDFKVCNTAVADSREKNPGSDETETEIIRPALEIVKESDKKEYVSGEKGYYKLAVRQLKENITEENIVIKDEISTPGATLNPESIVIKKNGEILKDTVIDSSDTGFVIRTGTGLSDRDTMEVCYEVLFELETDGTQTIRNCAGASGDLSGEVSDENEVTVTRTNGDGDNGNGDGDNGNGDNGNGNNGNGDNGNGNNGNGDNGNGNNGNGNNGNGNNGNGNNGNGNNGTGNNSGSDKGGSGGYSSGNGGSSGYSSGSGYGNYGGGSVAGISKTGDVRPFKIMSIIGILGILMMTGGIAVYRKTARGTKKK